MALVTFCSECMDNDLSLSTQNLRSFTFRLHKVRGIATLLNIAIQYLGLAICDRVRSPLLFGPPIRLLSYLVFTTFRRKSIETRMFRFLE